MTNDERLGPPPVEPLTEVAWSRVERGLWAALDAEHGRPHGTRPPRRWWIVAAPLVAAAAVIAIVLVRHPQGGEVGDEPSRVVSGAAPSAVSFGDAHVELDARTALAMSREAGHPIVLLERGAAWFTVAPRANRPAFIVRAGDATVRVVGTRFRVARSDERVQVEVEHGLVDVQFRGRVAQVGARQRWSSDAPGQTSTIASAAGDPVAGPSPTAGTTGPETPPAGGAATPGVTTPPGAAEVPATPARPAGKPGEPPGASPPAGRDATVAPHPAPARPAEPAALEPTAVERDRAEYDRLAALEPRDAGAALAGYLALARGTSRWADPALFAAARLAVDRHDRRAATLLGIYLQRFPDGANATDARQLLTRLKGESP